MIRNIIFDLGNVLIDIDFQRVKRSFESLGVENFEQQYSPLNTSDLFSELECGQVTPGAFYERIRQQSQRPLSDDDIRHAWNSILLTFRTESIDFLQTLKSRYRLFLLSNTNKIHLQEINRILFSQKGVSDLGSLFEKAFYSHEIGMRKPSLKAYQHVIEHAGIIASESIFIDDSFINIKPALEAGLQAHLLLPEERIESLRYFV